MAEGDCTEYPVENGRARVRVRVIVKVAVTQREAEAGQEKVKAGTLEARSKLGGSAVVYPYKIRS